MNIGREYLHWIDLGPTKLMEVSILKIYLTKFHFLQTLTFLRPPKPSTNTQKGPAAPKQNFVGPVGPFRARMKGPMGPIGPL